MLEQVLSEYIRKTIECKIGQIADILSYRADHNSGYFQFEVEPGKVNTRVIIQPLERVGEEVWPRIRLGIQFDVQLKKHPEYRSLREDNNG